MVKFPTNPMESLRQSIQPYVRDRLLINVLSEFFATFLLLLFGTGAIAQVMLPQIRTQMRTETETIKQFFAHGKSREMVNMREILKELMVDMDEMASSLMVGQVQVNLAWGVLISLCVYATYHTSGGHMNPAVSLAMTSMGKLPLLHFLAYFPAQMFGAFLGSGLSYHVYRNQIHHFHDLNKMLDRYGGMEIDRPLMELMVILKERQMNYTRTIFCSFPEEHVGHYTAFVDQIVGTALLLFAICALTDARNWVPTWLQPPGIGAALFLIGSSFGLNVGSPVNPARDFGPRLFALFIYGGTVFSHHGFYFWIPLLAPFVGALVGTWLYQLFIGAHVPDPTVVAADVDDQEGDEMEEEANEMEAAPGAMEGPTTMKNGMPHAIVVPMEMPQTAKTMPLTNMGPTSTMKSPSSNLGPGTQIVPPTTKMSSPSIDPSLYNTAKE